MVRKHMEPDITAISHTEFTVKQLLEIIQQACSQVLGLEPEETTLSSHFELDLVAGPDERAQIFSIVQEKTQVEFEPEDLQNVLTVAQLIELIEEMY